jgi:hypothetical protein
MAGTIDPGDVVTAITQPVVHAVSDALPVLGVVGGSLVALWIVVRLALSMLGPGTGGGSSSVGTREDWYEQDGKW